jgi:DNA-directed RNA polymerase II subunit RPB1
METLQLVSIQLGLYKDEEVRKLAVVQVTNPSTYDRGLPKANGVNDARMGVTDKGLQCPTCGLTSTCNNHYGYIELEKPVIRLGHIPSVLCLLRSVCWACSKAKFAEGVPGLVDIRPIIAKTPSGSKERLRAISEACKNKYKCFFCEAPQPVYSRVNKMFFGRTFRPKEMELFQCDEERMFATRRLFPDEIKSIFHHIPHESLVLLGYAPEHSHPEDYVMKAHIVPPPSIRPATSISSTEARMRGENDMTVCLQDIVRVNNELAAAEPEKMEQLWDKLQIYCGALINQNVKKLLTYNGTSVIHTRAIGKRVIKDIKKRLTGKKGRLRGNLSGKRVDHAARSVVGPDASHDIFDLGVPSSIMHTLTFPENVSDGNVKDLAMRVARGAHTKDGALTVTMPDVIGEKILHISLLDEEGRRQLAASLKPGFTVERHLKDGDWVLFNRQPSLHKASIMAFRAYEVPSAQFKLSLPCTKPFNADFDGDEMNMHALQDYCAVAEAQEIMAVPNQMVTPQSNSVIIALVQDSLVGAYLMSRQDAFVNREEAMQLAMCIKYSTKDRYSEMPEKCRSFIDDMGSFPEPAICKPQLWTGKQIFSWLLPTNLTMMKSINGTNPKNIDDIMNDTPILIRRGELMCGRLCKQSVGTTNNGIVQALWKQVSPWAAAKFVSDAQRLLMSWLRTDTISISIRDCLTSTDRQIDKLTSLAMGRVEEVERTDVPQEIKEVRQTQILQETLRNVGAEVLKNMDQKCGIATVVASGSKGNLMNIAQIAGLVGQQTINGSRISYRRGPRGLRTLASFAPNDNSPEARGFVASSYLMGLQPSEFFFHQQAGREGVVATAVSTADTGYNQRRMVKNQESEVVSYDLSVRVSSNLVVQLHYGGDDYDGTLAERVKLPILESGDIDSLFCKSTSAAEKKWIKRAYQELKDIKTSGMIYGSSIVAEVVMPVNLDRVMGSSMISSDGTTPAKPDRMLKVLLRGILKAHGCDEDGSITDLIFREHRNWRLGDDPSRQARLCVALQCTTSAILRWSVKTEDEDVIVSAFLRQYQRGIVNPGEGVGAVGSSSIGEPSTQMTLNIFHYSGIAEKNVTLTGLPRFKQIINAVDTYETANMRIALTPSCLGPKDAQTFNVRKFASRLVRTVLSHIVQKSFVCDSSDDDILKLALLYDTLSLPCMSPPPTTKSRKKVATRISSQSESQLSSFVAVYYLDKSATFSRNLTVEDVGSALSSFLGCDAVVTWTYRWVDEWIVVVRPPSWGDDRTITEAIHDALLESAVVNGTENIKKTVPMFVDNKWVVETEGSDLATLANLPEVDALNTITNNIQEALNLLGVEAAICLLQSELHRVLSFDGSYVDPRHTWLLADTVARSGSINPLNRHKMEEMGASLLQCASFEQTLDVFEHGAAFAKEDSLGGATEKLIVGQPVHVGTGSFGIISTQAHEKETGTYVEPLSRKTDGESFVEPLEPLRKTREATSVKHIRSTKSSFPTLLPSTDVGQSELLFAFSVMRKHALRRQVVIVSGTLDANKEDFLRAEKAMAKFSWIPKPKETQFTDIQFVVGEATVNTRIHNGNTSPPVHTSTTEQSSDFPIPETQNLFVLHVSAETTETVSQDSLPASVIPTSVTIKHERDFVKGPWTIRFTRYWKADSLIKAESLQHDGSDAASFSIKIILSNPWDIMEVRGSSDWALSGAMMERVMFILFSMLED